MIAGREESGRLAAGARLEDPREAVHPHRAAGPRGTLPQGALARQRPRPQVLSELNLMAGNSIRNGVFLNRPVLQLQCNMTRLNSHNPSEQFTSLLFGGTVDPGRGPLRVITTDSDNSAIYIFIHIYL